jgi:hypothetical protein
MRDRYEHGVAAGECEPDDRLASIHGAESEAFEMSDDLTTS